MKDIGIKVPFAMRPDIRSNQNELKSAIHRHQIILTKLKESPSDVQLQKQIESIQKHIMNLGIIQKKLVDDIRKEIAKKSPILVEKRKLKLTSDLKKPKAHKLKENAQKVALSARSATSALSLVSASSIGDTESAATGDAVLTLSSSTNQNTPVKDSAQGAATPLCSAKRSPSLSPPSKAVGSGDRPNKASRKPSSRSHAQKIRKGSCSPLSSDDSQDSTSVIKTFDPAVNSKLHFMTSIGLVTREVLTEIQNRRFERKRRSTANPQFSYGNNSETSAKRRKLTSAQNGESGNFVVERPVAAPNASCLVCSSAKGVLSVCWSCRKAFHWSCISEAPIPPPSEGQLHCSSCQPLLNTKQDSSRTVQAVVSTTSDSFKSSKNLAAVTDSAETVETSDSSKIVQAVVNTTSHSFKSSQNLAAVTDSVETVEAPANPSPDSSKTTQNSANAILDSGETTQDSAAKTDTPHFSNVIEGSFITTPDSTTTVQDSSIITQDSTSITADSSKMAQDFISTIPELSKTTLDSSGSTPVLSETTHDSASDTPGLTKNTLDSAFTLTVSSQTTQDSTDVTSESSKTSSGSGSTSSSESVESGSETT